MPDSKEILDINLKELSCLETIDHVIDNSDESMKMQRIKVYFKNGHTLSVIRGEYSFGGDEGLFEIMPNDDSFFDVEDSGDSVLGYLDIKRVNYYINKIGALRS